MNNYIKKVFIPIVSVVCLFLSLQINAQCPTSACSPFGFPDNFLELGTTNFTLNTINHNTNDRSIDPSYNDYSCSLSTNLVVGTSYNVSLTTTNGYFIHTEIWIDIDNNGFFNPFTESFFVTENFINQTGTITLPSSGVVLNTPLRLRILTEERNQDPFDPCGLPIWGQVEDYSIVALANNNPPVANFSANATVLCGGVVTFNDLSTNSPTSWLWNFGDGNTSTNQNPTHTYSSPGTYTVTLTSTNAFGFDSEVKTNYIINSSNSPANTCVPGIASNAGLGFGCGIYNFTLNSINKNSGGDTDGYQDYTCNQITTLFEATPYNVSIRTGATFEEQVKIFADINGDGIFQASEELYSNSGLLNHTGTLTIPNTALKDSLLRLRVTSDYIGATAPTACSTPQYSQVEDYAIIVQINNNPPVADFEVEEQISCEGFFKFKDLSINGVVDWFWDFGDGFTSILKNPSHTYINTGKYTVKLKTTNVNGIDSIVKVDYVQYHDTVPVAANCDPVTNNYCCSYGISNFTFGTINNSTDNGFVGYEDFTCKIRTNLVEGQSYPVSISTSSSFNQKTKIWIDYNNDGLFTDSSEIVFTSVDAQNPTGNIIIGSNAVYNTPLRLRVISDYASSSFTSCFNITHGQAEDYTVIIEQNVFPPVSEFDADPKVTCGNTISFFDESLNAPDSYLWDFGNGATSDLKNPVHVYENPGLYTVTLIVGNESGSDTTIKVDFINYQPSPIKSCIPTTISYCCNTGVQRFILNDIDNTSRDASIPYEDFSCIEFTTMKAGAKYPVKVTTGAVLSEHVIIWIDLNNDGEFDNDAEQVYTSTQLQNHFGEIDIPRTAVYDTSLRMRVTSESSSSPIPSGCSNLFNGQHEDYSIVLLEPDPLSINFSDVNSKIRVYPNPSNGIINIQNDSEELISEVSIINSLGEVILKYSNFNGQSINLDNISSGLYIIQITTKSSSINRNIIIDEK